MSDKAIELFIRMHLEKTPTLQRGRQVLTGDVIMGVMGAIQHQQPMGCDLISAKWLQDGEAIRRVDARIKQWAYDSGSLRPDLLYQVGLVGLAIFCGRPTNDQLRKLTSLWERFSEQGQRSKRLIKQYQIQIQSLDRKVCVSHSAQERVNDEIDYLNKLIDNEKVRLHKWAGIQAAKSAQCPKCHGSGISYDGKPCTECAGKGAFIPTAQNVREHLRSVGVVRITDKLWNTDIKPRFDQLMSFLQCEHDETAKLLSKRLDKEIVAYC